MGADFSPHEPPKSCYDAQDDQAQGIGAADSTRRTEEDRCGDSARPEGQHRKTRGRTTEAQSQQESELKEREPRGFVEYALNGFRESHQVLGCWSTAGSSVADIGERYIRSEEWSLGIIATYADADFCAFYKRHTAHQLHLPATFFPSENISVGRDRDQLPVLIEVIQSLDPAEIVSVPSVVWFETLQERDPISTDLPYFSLAEGIFKFFPRVSDSEVDATQGFSSTNAIGDCGGKRNVIENTAEIVNRVPYCAYKVRGQRSREGYLDELSALRICIGSRIVWALSEKGRQGVLKIRDVLVGPVKFLPSPE